jgi:hypothetical protein
VAKRFAGSLGGARAHEGKEQNHARQISGQSAKESSTEESSEEAGEVYPGEEHG